ncbi:hypothetical protein Taro_046820 [Colocasia esculenta]|uniref:aldehyde oxygenase (deformylating) n=1 Tax=Colocasia esculenta TaxID=4460 RepID=A0A843WR24_COLES|nr:hypothetical protein [Colocasia esculenta]
MAANPGFFTAWPWQRLGNFKYLLLAPFVGRSVYRFVNRENGKVDLANLVVIPILLVRVAHSLFWISWARFQTARSKRRIVNKSIDFEQVDRERNWDDQILMTALLLYLGNMFLPGATYVPWWNTWGVVLTALLHAGPVEFLYYWFHRALHHHYLYSRYHSHHHASIVTEPITAVIHPFAEEFAYFLLFAIPITTTVFSGCISVASVAGYLLYIDFMNYLGHCNFELVPKWLFRVFPPLKYLMYTPTFHSLHHTQFRTNYSLFIPLYDYIYGTTDKSSDDLYESASNGKEEMVDIVHLTHPTTLESLYHLRLGLASLASKPYTSRWYVWAMWPFTFLSLLLSRISGSTFVVEKNRLKSLTMQTWAIPRFSFQYKFSWERDTINELIEKAVLQADEQGVKVMSLGLLNQGEEINGLGELYVRKHPKLRIRIVDGSTLAAAAVIQSIPEGTEEVLLRGKLSKVAFIVATALCQKSIQVVTVKREEFEKLKLRLPTSFGSCLVLSNSYTPKASSSEILQIVKLSCLPPQIWLVGDGLSAEEQGRAVKGTCFIPFSQFPTKKTRTDCVYYSTPAMVIPKEFENMHACENWLPRRVMSACRVAGIVHALEGWKEHETGNVVLDVEDVWCAALSHGFLPLPSPLAV